MTQVIPKPFPDSMNNLNLLVTQKYLNYKNGVFVEAGAADGFQQSNTWNLEKFKNWTGILVEPNKQAYETCVINRPNSKVYNYALVEKDFKDTEIEMFHRKVFENDSGLQNTASFSPLNEYDDWKVHNVVGKYKIKTKTLDSILEENNIQYIDYLSLDVEGLELNVLNGFTIEKYLPKLVTIECHLDIDKILKYMDNTHVLIEIVGNHDYIFLLKYFNNGLIRDMNT